MCMLKRLLNLVVVSVVIFFTLSSFAFAGPIDASDAGGEDGTILPGTVVDTAGCKAVMNYVHSHSSDIRDVFKKREDAFISVDGVGEAGFVTAQDILGCGIKTGNISLWMVPYYVRYILEFVIQLGGLVGVGGIIYGGYLYLFAGVSEDKDKGKKAIIYSVSGIVLTLVAWALVNIVITIVTA